MSKAEQFIQEHTRNKVNHITENFPWITVEEAKEAVKIAREEMIEKAAKWLSKLSNYNADFIYPSHSGTIENFANSFKQAMKDELSNTEEDIQASISEKELIPYIMKQGEALSKQVWNARKKYGERYNYKNNFEEMFRRFGDPKYPLAAEHFAKEYTLILQKKSSLPATVRYTVLDICAAAMKECYHDKAAALYKKQQEEKKSKED